MIVEPEGAPARCVKHGTESWRCTGWCASLWCVPFSSGSSGLLRTKGAPDQWGSGLLSDLFTLWHLFAVLSALSGQYGNRPTDR